MKSKFDERLKGSIRQINDDPPLWQVYFSRNGKRYFIQKDYNQRPLRTYEAALDLLDSIRSSDKPNTPWACILDPDYMLVRDHAMDFDKLARKWADSSTCEIEWKEKRKRIVENVFIPEFRKKSILSFEDDDIKRFQNKLYAKGLKDKTVRNYMMELKEFFKSKRKMIPADKMPDFPRVKVQRSTIKQLSREEQDQVFEFLAGHNLPIFTFLRYVPCRPNEAGALQKTSVDVRKKVFFIENGLGKGRRLKDTKTKIPRKLPLIPEILEVIRPLMDKPGDFVFLTKDGNPYTTTRLERIWRAASKKANKKYGTRIVNLYNSFKHSFGSQRREEGYPLDLIQDAMGHTDSKSTRVYSNVPLDRLAEVMRGRTSQVVHSGDNQEKPNDFNEKESGREDLNLRHLTPHASALPGCATPR